MQYKIPFSGRAHSYTKEEQDIVIDVMQNANPLTQGIFQESFQKKFCDFMSLDFDFDFDFAFALNNATSALVLSAQLCQFKSYDEVIIPSHTYTASAYPFLKQGAKIVWADIDLSTRVVTAKTIQACITSKTKAIVVVHLYGYCADMPEIMQLAKENNLLVIEDCAQAIGSKINGKMAGSFGDFGIFSFHSHKNISTLGEGGMISVKDEKFAKIIPLLRHHGHCDFSYDRKKYWLPAMGNLDFPELNSEKIWPNNFCLGEVECALGEKLLDRVELMNLEKRKRALRFIDELDEFTDIEFHRVDTDRHNYHLLVGKVANNKRDIFIDKMSQKGVQCVVQYYPLNRYDFYVKAGYGDAKCPSADDFYDNMVSFPFSAIMDIDSFEEMLDITKVVLAKLA